MVPTPQPETDRPPQAPVTPLDLTAGKFDELLEQAGNWRDRWSVFQQIPKLLKSAESAVK